VTDYATATAAAAAADDDDDDRGDDVHQRSTGHVVSKLIQASDHAGQCGADGWPACVRPAAADASISVCPVTSADQLSTALSRYSRVDAGLGWVAARWLWYFGSNRV